MDDLTPTRSVLLELKEESQSMREAYSFLDEKRMLLASTLVQQVENYDEVRRGFIRSFELAVPALREAVFWHGLEALQCQPIKPFDLTRLMISKKTILGVDIYEPTFRPSGEDTTNQSILARQCARRFQDLTVQAAKLAALSGNLLRLFKEYKRTERRARALEDVLIPELEETTRNINDHLEAIDLEEAVRIRCLRKV